MNGRLLVRIVTHASRRMRKVGATTKESTLRPGQGNSCHALASNITGFTASVGHERDVRWCSSSHKHHAHNDCRQKHEETGERQGSDTTASHNAVRVGDLTCDGGCDDQDSAKEKQAQHYGQNRHWGHHTSSRFPWHLEAFVHCEGALEGPSRRRPGLVAPGISGAGQEWYVMVSDGALFEERRFFGDGRQRRSAATLPPPCEPVSSPRRPDQSPGLPNHTPQEPAEGLHVLICHFRSSARRLAGNLTLAPV